MKYKSSTGFTLIELLVAITIVGILASAGFAVYTNQIDKANDTRRLDNMKNILNIVRRDSIENKNGGNTFVYDEEEIKTLLAKMNYEAQTSGSEICYFLGIAEGADVGSGHDNEIAIATWGDGLSTADGSKAGVLVVGTNQAMTNLSTAPVNVNDCPCSLTRANFLCETPDAMQVAQAYFARVDHPSTSVGFDYADVDAVLSGPNYTSCGTCPAYPN